MCERLELMRWLARYAARVAVRRVVGWLLLAVLAAFGASKAHAQDYTRCFSETGIGTRVPCAEMGEASAAAAKEAARIVAQFSGDFAKGARYVCRDEGWQIICQILFNGGAQTYGYVERNYPTGKTCAARNANALADAALGFTEPSTCIGGCAVQGSSFTGTLGTVKTYGMKDRTYTGGICSPIKPSNDIGEVSQEKEEATKPKPPECTALGSGQTGCQKPNGEYCASASTGKSFCWQPHEAGKKVDGSDGQVKSKQGEPVTPPSIQIEGKDWQRKEGHQATACINNTCITYNVTNYQTVPGGSAKNSTGDNKTDGTGNTSGNGAPDKDSGEKGDNDDGDSASDSGNCEAPPACTGNTLKCLHLRYTWKIECNSRSGEITNGNGCGENDVPICAGSSCKAEAYSQLLQQWKQRCAAQAMGEGMAARAVGTRGSNGDDAGVVDGIWGGENGGSGLTLRRDLINVGGGGRLLPTGISIEGQAWEVPQGFYDAVAAIRLVIIAMCTVIAMFVVGRSI